MPSWKEAQENKSRKSSPSVLTWGSGGTLRVTYSDGRNWKARHLKRLPLFSPPPPPTPWINVSLSPPLNESTSQFPFVHTFIKAVRWSDRNPWVKCLLTKMDGFTAIRHYKNLVCGGWSLFLFLMGHSGGLMDRVPGCFCPYQNIRALHTAQGGGGGEDGIQTPFVNPNAASCKTSVFLFSAKWSPIKRNI